jgi:hypothetical protein
MKLAKVDHIRCGEYSATTFLMVPDELTEDEFHDAVQRAKDKYLEALAEWRDAKPVNHPGNALTIYPGKPPAYPLETSLGDMLADLAAKREKYQEWEDKRSRALQNFGSFLRDEIAGSHWIWQTEQPSATVNWGHFHGEPIDYGDEDSNDLPGPSRLNLTAEELAEIEDL